VRGHIRKRGKTWTAVAFTGRGPNGKPKYVWRGGHRTRKEAQAALTELLSSLATGAYVSKSKLTVADWLRQWIAAERINWRPSTVAGRVVAVEQHLCPKLGEIRLQQLSPQAITACYGELLESGRSRGKGGLSVRSVRIAHGVLRKALADAVDARLLETNPAARARPPKARTAEESARKARRFWTAAEVAQFLGSVSEHRLRAAFWLAFSAGLRRGELLGLRWRDLDLGTGVLRVEQTLLEPRTHVDRDGKLVWEYRLTLSPPKTVHSRRSVDLDAETVAVLREHRKRQTEERLAFGPGWGTHELADDLVFRDEAGGPLVPHLFTNAFQLAVKKAGLPRSRLHDARHTHVALLAAAGVPAKVIQERVGHHSAGFTLDNYGGTFPAQHRSAAEKYASLVGGVSAATGGVPVNSE
jgi:integrase